MRDSDIIIAGVNTTLKQAEELVLYVTPFPFYTSKQLSMFQRDTVSLKTGHNSALSKFPTSLEFIWAVSLQKNITKIHNYSQDG